ncbi:hypothetical protein CC78DRAFT_580959 [Lojkania enalia]|uniref:Uncharacterized protein n=1 Tax=Lojkania enalia TaxID=147567 RepID=A0A9P4K8T5_9PLEO|nr:hypothetical protein CC78DRAFT_580959 [Didymosphaeria enalia]
MGDAVTRFAEPDIWKKAESVFNEEMDKLAVDGKAEEVDALSYHCHCTTPYIVTPVSRSCGFARPISPAWGALDSGVAYRQGSLDTAFHTSSFRLSHSPRRTLEGEKDTRPALFLILRRENDPFLRRPGLDPMALNHASIPETALHRPTAPSPSYATHLSLRGADAQAPLHPLKQNPPSIASIPEDEDISTFDDVDITDPVRPPPSALTAAPAYNPHAVQSSAEIYSSSPHIGGHRRSMTDTLFTNCQPLLNRATSTLQQHSSRASFRAPTKSLASFIPSRKVLESTASQPKFRAGAQAISNWFNGSSAPVNIGVTSKDYLDDEYDSEEDEGDETNKMMASIFNRGSALPRSTEVTSNPPSSVPAQTQPANTTSKFGWLLSSHKNATSAPPTSSPTYHNPDDELLNLDISQSLFPHGPVDPLAPSSFHDLISNAEALLNRYQKSYRQLSTTLSDAQAEQSAQDDELDEAETRVRHLKMQLETMASRANEQDEQMRRLMEELMFERRARQEEEAARKRSLALIRGPNSPHALAEAQSPRRRPRASNSNVSVDSGFESECDSEAASIFSRANGATSPTDTIPSSAASDVDGSDSTPKGRRPQPLQRRSTYDKVRDGSINLEKGGWGCANCEGGAQAAVWGRLAKEREENSMLRRRVQSLEDAVEGALNVVDGPWRM